MSPGHLEVTVPAGGLVEKTLVVTPATEEKTRVTVSVEAFALDSDGKPWRGPGSETPRSAPALLEIRPTGFALENGQPSSLQVMAKLPASARGSYWAAIALQVEPVESPGTEDAANDVVVRLVVPVFVTAEGSPAPRLAVEDASARLTADGVDIVATIENVGVAVVRTLAFLTLEQATARGPVEVASTQLNGLTLLPGFPRRIHSVVRLPAGVPATALAARVLVPYGEHLAEGEAKVPLAAPGR